MVFGVCSDPIYRFLFKKGECIMYRAKVLLVVLILCISSLIALDALCASTRYCGNAKLVDSSGNVIVSTGNIYSDLSIGGLDKVQVETDNTTGKLTFLRAFIGKLELPYRSSSRVKFLFDVYASAKKRPGSGTAVYDSLVKLPNGARRGDLQTNGKYYIDYETIHFGVQYDPNGTSRAIFMIDPGCVADITQNPLTISQASLNQFYGNKASYLTPLQFSIDTGDPNQPIGWQVSDTDPHDQIAYYLFINQLNFKPTEYNGTKPCTWEITPKTGTVTLYARDINNNLITLATYSSLPFKMIVSTKSLSYPAPSRNTIISQTWGEIKAE
jgi:hypothetical protein